MRWRACTASGPFPCQRAARRARLLATLSASAHFNPWRFCLDCFRSWHSVRPAKSARWRRDAGLRRKAGDRSPSSPSLPCGRISSRGPDLNRRPSGYEPAELPLLHPAWMTSGQRLAEHSEGLQSRGPLRRHRDLVRLGILRAIERSVEAQGREDGIAPQTGGLRLDRRRGAAGCAAASGAAGATTGAGRVPPWPLRGAMIRPPRS